MTDQPKRGGLPPVDLSGDLGPPTSGTVNRSAGLAGLVKRPAPPPTPAASPEPEDIPPSGEEKPAGETAGASTPAPSPPPPPSPPSAPPTPPAPKPPADTTTTSSTPAASTPADDEELLISRGKQPTTLYVSASLQRRFERYRRSARGRTNTSVALEAITALRPRLREILTASRVAPSVGGDLFPSDPAQVRYLGMGSVQIQISPTYPQLQVLDDLTAELGFPRRATWIAPVLNEFLPGRKETRPAT